MTEHVISGGRRALVAVWRVITSRGTGALALIGIFLVVAFGTTKDRAQDDQARAAAAQSTETSCAVAEFAGNLGAYFGGSVERTRSRIGTADELSTDQASVEGLETLLGFVDRLGTRVNPNCGLVVVPPTRTP